jgi:hypothetical protein
MRRWSLPELRFQALINPRNDPNGMAAQIIPAVARAVKPPYTGLLRVENDRLGSNRISRRPQLASWASP